tara:strand:- start:729 stop:1070 length:342 start_codon:yes stop_codon:yes gene_type:complete
MKKSSFSDAIYFGEKGIKAEVILESSFTKEIRIMLKKGCVMKEHKTPYTILVHLLKGNLDFTMGSEMHGLVEGDILTLEGNVVHELAATEDSMVRLTLSKLDKIERVKSLEGS